MSKPIWTTKPGRIAEVSSGASIRELISFTATGSVPLVDVISGNLPDSIYLEKATAYSYYVTGTVPKIDFDEEYFFTVRAKNNDGIADLSLSILNKADTLDWIQNSDIGSYNSLSSIDYKFTINNLDGDAKFEKVAGTLPNGIILLPTGVLSGTFDIVIEDTTYSFRVRATLENDTYLEKEFTITVKEYIEANAPVWLTSIGYIGSLQLYEDSGISVKAIDLHGSQITYSIKSGYLPERLQLNPRTGAITGKMMSMYQGDWKFTISASNGMISVDREFYIVTNDNSANNMEWETDSDLGTLAIGDISYIQVNAHTDIPAYYEIIDGYLPSGLRLNSQTGEIWGTVKYQNAKVYTFTIRAKNGNAQSDKVFKITVKSSKFNNNTASLYFGLSHTFDEKWRRFIFQIPFDLYYNAPNPIFGPHLNGKLYLNYAVAKKTKTTLESTLNYTYPIIAKFGDIKSAIGRIDDKILYTVYYREIVDCFAAKPFNFLIKNDSIEIKPTSFITVRDDIQNKIGLIDTEDKLPLWMTCEQVAGVPSSVIGWKPCIVMAYLNYDKHSEWIQNDPEKDYYGKNLMQIFNTIDSDISTQLKGQRIVFNDLKVEPYFSGAYSQYSARIFTYQSEIDLIKMIDEA